jgi:hypothetical protein
MDGMDGTDAAVGQVAVFQKRMREFDIARVVMK